MQEFLINHRPPTRPERFVQDIIDSSKDFFAYLFRGSCLEYWLLDPNGQAYTLFLMMLLGVSTWLLILNHNSKTFVALKPEQDWPESQVAEEMDIDGEEYQGDEHQPSTPRPSSYPREVTPIMRKLAPPGHHPVNAHIEGSPFRVKQPLGPRIGQFVSSDHPAPSPLNPRVSKAFSTRHLPRNNFSDLARDAPMAKQSLHDLNKLNVDGTRKEWEMEKPVVAHWSNEGMQRYGRASLRRELDNKYFS